MHTIGTFSGRSCLAFTCSLFLVALLPAQSVLLIDNGGKLEMVRRVVGVRAFVEENGKLVASYGTRCGLKPVPEYLPVFIAVRNMTVSGTSLSFGGGGGGMNHELHVQAEFESPYRLDDVFLVLEMGTEAMGKVLLYYEVGNLKPAQLRFFHVTIPMTAGMGGGHFKLHLFTGGAEVFHSEMPAAYREGKLDQMVLKRLVGVKDAAPAPFVGPPPEYPAALRKKKVKGNAMVAIGITARGAVMAPVLVSATDPAFGDAALAAVRQWRFLPAVKDGRAVETKVDVPFNFSPTEDSESGQKPAG